MTQQELDEMFTAPDGISVDRSAERKRATAKPGLFTRGTRRVMRALFGDNTNEAPTTMPTVQTESPRPTNVRVITPETNESSKAIGNDNVIIAPDTDELDALFGDTKALDTILETRSDDETKTE